MTDLALSQGELKQKIAEIDAMFDAATGWGSWMWEASGYRRYLVEQLKTRHGEIVEHKHERKIG